jgi:large subunit ribosomal protein L1
MAQSKKKQELEAQAEEKVEVAEAQEQVADIATEGNTNVADDQPETERQAEAKAEAADSDDDADAKPAAKAGKRSAKAQREAEEEDDRQAAKEARAETEAEEKPKASKRQMPNPLKQHGKKYRAAAEQVEKGKQYGLDEALDLAKKTSFTKFDASVELHIGLGVDPRQADQMVRANVVLPAGTGKALKVAVIAPEAKQAEAKQAGADIAAGEEFLAEIEKGKLDFDLLIATPDMMAKLGKVAKVLGPRGLMPNPKSGTVTADVAKAVSDAKGGKVEFRIDKQAIIHQAVGKVSFKEADLKGNVLALVDAILKAKPSTAKGTYVLALSITTTMGPGIKLDPQAVIAEANPKR